MRAFDKRLRALEGRQQAELTRPWHIVLVNDEGENAAIARFETEHGPIDGDNLMFVQFV